MNNKNIYYFIGFAILLITIAYIAKFFPLYGSNLSSDTAVWGQFGDYVGGTLNPILSSLSVILLIKSVTLQTEANKDLKKELKNNEKSENFRSFNDLFFNMIESQKSSFRDFKIYAYCDEKIVEKSGSIAVSYIEEEIEKLREANASEKVIGEFLEELDYDDKIFGILRMFYVTVKATCDKLCENNGFEPSEASEQIINLVNFTEFSHLRLIVIGVQFLNYKSCKYLKENDLFISSLSEVGLALDLY